MRLLNLLLASTFVAACGGTLTDQSDAGDAGDAGLDVAADVVQKDVVADAPVDVTQPPLGGMTFAVQRVYLGEADRQGNPSATAWKAYGRDIDGLATTSQSTNVCTLTAGAPKSNQVDGNGGIDNAFGAVIVPILQTAASSPAPSANVTAAIQSGASTLLIEVVGLTNDASQTATGLSAQIFGGANYGGTPAFDSTTIWPVLASTVADGKTLASGATAVFPGSSITGGTFTTAASTASVTFTLALGGLPFPITVHDPIVTFDHVDATDAANGTLSGVIDTNELITTLQALAGSISLSLCGSAFDGIAAQIRQAQDILLDGSNAPNTACTGISIGLGFDAKLVGAPNTVVPDPQTPNPCGP